MISPRASAVLAGIVLSFQLGVSLAQDTPRDVVLMLDNSGSMVKNDPEFLTSVAVRTFLQNLEGDIQVAIVIFDQSVRVAVPLRPLDEDSRSVFLNSLDQVTFKGQLTNSPAALERSIYELRTNGRFEAEKSIIFMTDGIVDTGDTQRDLDKSQWMQDELADEAAEAGIRIFGVAFTDNADYQLIQTLARKTNGQYFRAYTPEDIDGVFESVSSALEESLALPLPTASLSGLPEVEPLPDRPDAIAEALPELPESLPELLPPDSADLSQPPDLALPSDSASAQAAPEFQVPHIAIEPGESALPITAIAIAVAFLILIGVVVAVLLIRRKGSGRGKAPGHHVPQAFLNDLAEVSGSKSYELDDNISIIGRMAGQEENVANYIVIDENTMGRRHAIVEYKNHGFWVSDQNSLNGTFVNDQRVEHERQLKHGDRLRFYKYEFEFVMPEMFGTGMTLFSRTMFAQSNKADGGGETTKMRAPRPDDATQMTFEPDPRIDSGGRETER